RYLGIDYKTVNKYWNMTLEEYAKLKEDAKSRTKKVDKYKELILSWIQEFRDISTSQIYDWLIERYDKLDFKDRALRLYVSDLREEYNLPKVPCIRQYEEVAELPMGYQAQVDFGEIWLSKCHGSKIKVYCFAMVLSHSRYKFLWWRDKPFTTLSLVDAHNKAFEYFGGMPKEIVYDQDRILAVSENNGDIIYTEGFQNYISSMGFKTRLCRAYDPESKGKIEAVVKFAKYNFAKHRVFEDIDSFNEDSFKWLDRTGNTKVHEITRKVPKEVFALEKEHLLKVPSLFKNIQLNNSLTYCVRKNNTILYKQNRYQVPKGTYRPGKEVKLVISHDKMDIVDLDTGLVIVSHKVSSQKGKLIQIYHPEREKSKTKDEMYDKAFKALGMSEDAKELLDNIKKEKERYCRDQFGLIIRVVKDYDETIIGQALEYCVKRKLFSAGMFKDTLEYLKLQKETDITKKYTKVNISIPSKYQSLKPEIRNINEYINALKEDKKVWKN
ncbi:hypothetical protein DU75_03615, partial [Methanosarcina mazei]